MQIGSLIPSGCSLYIFFNGRIRFWGLWVCVWGFLDSPQVLLCLSVFILLHSPFLYILILLMWSKEVKQKTTSFFSLFTPTNVHLRGFSGLISVTLFHFSFVLDSFSSFLHSPPHICSWCFLPAAPDPLPSEGSLLYNSNTVAWHLYVERLWAESAFLQLIGQKETLLFHSSCYSALIQTL